MEAFSLPLIALSIVAIIVWGVLGQRAAERKDAKATAEAEAEAEAEKATLRPSRGLRPR